MGRWHLIRAEFIDYECKQSARGLLGFGGHSPPLMCQSILRIYSAAEAAEDRVTSEPSNALGWSVTPVGDTETRGGTAERLHK